MNKFYFDSNSETIKDYRMASFDVVKTKKSQEQFMIDYEQARLKGNSILDSIDWAK